MTDEKKLNKSQVSRIKPSYLVLFFPLGYFCGTSWLFFFRWVEMKNLLNKWLAILKSHLIGVAGNPQTSHEERSNKSTCCYFLIGEQTKGSFLGHSLGQSYQMRKLYLRSTAGILGGGTESGAFSPFSSWCFRGIEHTMNTRENFCSAKYLQELIPQDECFLLLRFDGSVNTRLWYQNMIGIFL